MHILTVGTEWGSSKGGVSTFNRGLSASIGELGHRVTCYVPHAGGEALADANARGVELLTPLDVRGIGDESSLLLPPERIPNTPVDVVIGHGRITGVAAWLLRRQCFPDAKLVHFVHMSPRQIEFHKASASVAAPKMLERIELESWLAARADVVAAVGPLLTREVKDWLRGQDISPIVHTFLPGLDPLPRPLPAELPGSCRVIVVGRAEDYHLKGLDIAVRAVSKAVGLLGRYQLQRSGDVTLVILGSPSEELDKIHARLRESRSGPIEVQTLPFSEPAQVISQIRQSSLALMPSRVEGFGLSGLEAIAHGIPTLVSRRSGLAEVLFATLSDDLRDWAVCEVADDPEEAASVWAESVARILNDRADSFAKANRIRDELAERLIWRTGVSMLIERLGDQVTEKGLSEISDRSRSSRPDVRGPQASTHVSPDRNDRADRSNGRAITVGVRVFHTAWGPGEVARVDESREYVKIDFEAGFSIDVFVHAPSLHILSG